MHQYLYSFLTVYFSIVGTVSVSYYSNSTVCVDPGTVPLNTYNLATGISYLILAFMSALFIYITRKFGGDNFFNRSVKIAFFFNAGYCILLSTFLILWGPLVGGISFLNRFCRHSNFIHHKDTYIMAVFTILSSLLASLSCILTTAYYLNNFFNNRFWY